MSAFNVSPLGNKVLLGLTYALDVADKALTWDESWWGWFGPRLRQRFIISHEGTFTVARDGIAEELPMARLRVSTLLVHNVKAPEGEVERVLASLNPFMSTSALGYHPEERVIFAEFGQYVHDAWAVRRVALAAELAPLQLLEAETMADDLAAEVCGEVSVFMPPDGVAREAVPRMIKCLSALQEGGSLGVSTYTASAEFEKLSAWAASAGLTTLTSGPDGVSFEVTLGKRAAHIGLSTAIAHPRWGPGLSLQLTLLLGWTDLAPAAEAVASMNNRETDGLFRGQHIGAWRVVSTNGQYFLGYFVFLPNALHIPGLTSDITFNLVEKARWVMQLTSG